MKSSKKKLTRHSRGFTLIESLFAIFLIVLCAGIVSASIPISTNSRVKAELRDRATGLAQKMLEATKEVGYQTDMAKALYTRPGGALIDSETPVAANTYSFNSIDTSIVDSPSQVLPSGSGLIKIEQVDTDLKRVVVTVFWNERGTTKNIKVASLVANLQ